MKPAWTENWREVLAFGVVLRSATLIVTGKEVYNYFTKPWKWDEDYQVWVECGKPRPTENERFGRFLSLTSKSPGKESLHLSEEIVGG